MFAAILVLAATFSLTEINKLITENIIKDLFNKGHANDSTGYMNGIKAISMIFIVMGHSYTARLVMALRSGENLLEFDSKSFYQPLGMTGMAMEPFFIAGGILTAMSLKKGMEST